MVKKIYLFCSSGMSTSLLVSKMLQAGKELELAVDVRAFPYDKLGEIFQNDRPDCILIGPQLRFMLSDVKKKYEGKGVPAAAISPADYGSVDGGKVLSFALSLIAQKSQG